MPETPVERLESAIQTILTPFEGDNPTGDCLRYEPVYDAIQEARRQDNQALPQGIWKQSLKKANWQEVEEMCLEVLTHQSKDLQIAAWLTQAWGFLFGIKGLMYGIGLVDELSRTFWDKIYPELDPQTPDLRIAPYLWMDSKLVDVILETKISQPQQTDLQGHTFSQWIHGQYLEKLSYKQKDPQNFLKKEAQTNQKILTHVLLKSIQHTAPKFYETLQSDINACIHGLEKLEIFLDKTLSNYTFYEEVPGFFNLKKHLRELDQLCGSWKKEDEVKGEENPSNPTSITNAVSFSKADVDVNLSTDQQQINPTTPSDGGEKTAWEQLETLSRHLIQSDQNAPSSYFLNQALIWKDQNFFDLFHYFKDKPDHFYAILQFLTENLNQK